MGEFAWNSNHSDDEARFGFSAEGLFRGVRNSNVGNFPTAKFGNLGNFRRVIYCGRDRAKKGGVNSKALRG